MDRYLSLGKHSSSLFLFGCRQAGKTWLLKNTLNYDLYIDLLDNEDQFTFLTNPQRLSEEIAALNKPKAVVIIDEIQKVPNLLDEIHRLIESPLAPKFILTGSSARKLKRSHANMLGGRALTYTLYPLTYFELKENFNLTYYLQYGGIPNIYLAETSSHAIKMLQSYVTTYLKEEILDESLTRNLPSFSKFLELAAFENGNLINYSNISREIGVAADTVKEYFSILEDTLLGFFLQPFHRSPRSRLVTHAKFYFIDTGIVFALKKMLSLELTPAQPLYGDAFEHFIILEVKKAISYLEEEINLYFFRTYDGTEVDLILEKHGEIIPVEIKSSANPRKIAGLKSFLTDHKVHSAYCVCQTVRPFKQAEVLFIPWQDFITKLYNRELFSSQ